MNWQIGNPSIEDLIYLRNGRYLSHSILDKFISHIHLVSHQDGKSGNKNIGFPLSIPGVNKTYGYQLVNYNFDEIVVADGNSGVSWNVNFNNIPEIIDTLYIFTDPIDLMSFCEIFYKKLNFDITAFSCVQRNITDAELATLVNFFPKARIYTCFDFNWQGSVLDIRTVAIKNRESVQFNKIGTLVSFEWKQKFFQLPVQDLNFAKFRSLTNIKTNVKVIKPRNALTFSSQLTRLRNNHKSILGYNYEEI